jgi:hypothetical protein
MYVRNLVHLVRVYEAGSRKKGCGKSHQGKSDSSKEEKTHRTNIFQHLARKVRQSHGMENKSHPKVRVGEETHK